MGRHRPEQDHTLENLLDLDGDIYVIDEAAGYWVKFVVRRVTPSPERPHGVEYSLTMHDSNNRRLVGFDNAHPVPGTKRSERGVGRAGDHRHRLGTVKAYPYENAAKLVADFWEAVDEVLKLKGDTP
ncbi:MAG: DUF6516 family protein [Terriglobales bacterium]